MDIHIHAPDSPVDEEEMRGLVAKDLGRFAERVTRIDAFLRDVNAHKGGEDQRCVLEARPRGLDPVTAEHQAATVREALETAARKLERVLESRFGKLGGR